MVATVGNGVVVLPSTIPFAGVGLFATRNFKKNEIITGFSGEIIDRKEADKRRKLGLDTHIRDLDKPYVYIDGFKTIEESFGKGGAQFANDALDNELNNAVFYKRYGTDSNPIPSIWLKAKRDIKSGEEIFVSYGKDYWKIHPLNNNNGRVI